MLSNSSRRGKPAGNFSGDPLDPPRQELAEYDSFLDEIKTCAQNMKSNVQMLVDAPVPVLQRLEKFFPEGIAGGVTVALMREELTAFAEACKAKNHAIDGVINRASDLQSKNVHAKEALEKVVGSWNEAAHYSQKVEGLRGDTVKKGNKVAEKLQRNEQKKHESEQAFQASMGEAASVLSKVLSQQWANTVGLLAELCKYYTAVFQSSAKLSKNCVELADQFVECQGSDAMVQKRDEIVSEVWARVQDFLGSSKRPLHSTGSKGRTAWSSLDDGAGLEESPNNIGTASETLSSSAPSRLASSRRFSTMGIMGRRSRASPMLDDSDPDSPEPAMGHVASAPSGVSPAARRNLESADEFLSALKESATSAKARQAGTEKKDRSARGDNTPTKPFSPAAFDAPGAGNVSAAWGQWPDSASTTQADASWGSEPWPSQASSANGWDATSTWGAGSTAPPSGRPSMEPCSYPMPTSQMSQSGRPSMEPCSYPTPTSGRPSIEPGTAPPQMPRPSVEYGASCQPHTPLSGRPSFEPSVQVGRPPVEPQGWSSDGQGGWSGDSTNPFVDNPRPSPKAGAVPMGQQKGPAVIPRNSMPPTLQRAHSGRSTPGGASPQACSPGGASPSGMCAPRGPGAGPPQVRRPSTMGGPVPGSAVGYSPWGPVSGSDNARRSASLGSPHSPQGVQDSGVSPTGVARRPPGPIPGQQQQRRF